MALTDQVLMPGSDYQAICDATRALIGTSATLKSGEIAGALSNVQVSSSSETWVWNVPITPPSESEEVEFEVNFESNLQNFTGILIDPDVMAYKTAEGNFVEVCYGGGDWGANSPLFRKIIITGSYSDDFKTWIEANAIKQEKNLATSPSTNVTVTNKGQTITPNVPYDAMESIRISGFSSAPTTTTLSMSSGDMLIPADSTVGYMTQVTVKKPSTLIPENIKSGVDIGGIVGTMEEGSGNTFITVSESSPTSSDGNDGDIWVVASNA